MRQNNSGKMEIDIKRRGNSEMVTPLRQHPPTLPRHKAFWCQEFHSWLYLLLPDIPTLPARETSLTFISSSVWCCKFYDIIHSQFRGIVHFWQFRGRSVKSWYRSGSKLLLICRCFYVQLCQWRMNCSRLQQPGCTLGY